MHQLMESEVCIFASSNTGLVNGFLYVALLSGITSLVSASLGLLFLVLWPERQIALSALAVCSAVSAACTAQGLLLGGNE